VIGAVLVRAPRLPDWSNETVAQMKRCGPGGHRDRPGCASRTPSPRRTTTRPSTCTTPCSTAWPNARAVRGPRRTRSPTRPSRIAQAGRKGWQGACFGDAALAKACRPTRASPQRRGRHDLDLPYTDPAACWPGPHVSQGLPPHSGPGSLNGASRFVWRSGLTYPAGGWPRQMKRASGS